MVVNREVSATRLSQSASGRSSARRAALVLSVLVGALAGAAALCGLLIAAVYGGPASVVEMLRGYDLVTLVLVVPSLAGSLFWANRGSDGAQLVWAGSLAYLAYTYAFAVFGTSFSDYSLLHVAVLGASIFALIATMATVDVTGIAARFGTRTPRRLVATVLALLAVALGGMWTYFGLRYAMTGAVPTGSALVEPELVVHLGIGLDLALLVPGYALAAVLLWRRAAWGYVLAALVLVSGTLHQISYLVALPFQVVGDVPGAVAFDPAEPVIALLYALATAAILWGAGRATGGAAS